MNPKPALLLHICCAPCSTHVVQSLKENYDIVGYFYGPNIQPKAEYKRRLQDMKDYAKMTGIKLIEGEYDVERWFESTKGFEDEPEGGRRCEICYRLRMESTAKLAKDRGFKYFTTTLTISPHKDAGIINSIGRKLSEKYGVGYHSADFKKKDGFKKSVEMSKEAGLYRQSYCGCVYSMKR